MKGFFSVDGTFFSVTSKIVDMTLLTILWLVGCIPIVTILTSTSSLYQATVKCIRYDRGKPYQEFLDAYRKNLKQGIGLTLLYGAVGAVIGYADYYIFCLMESRTNAAFMVSVFMLIASLVYLANIVWIIPVFSRFSNTFGKILQLNFVVSIHFVIRSILMIGIVVIAVMLILSYIPLMILLPSLTLLVLSYLSEPGLHRYMPKQEEDNGDWRYGYK